MLVVSRKRAESICISDSVVVTVLRIRGGQVKIGIDAPRGTPVHRGELCEKARARTAQKHVEVKIRGEVG